MALVPFIETLITPLLPESRPHNTVIITVDPDRTQGMDQDCGRRYQLYKLLKAARDYHAGGFVADFTLDSDSPCRYTEDLRTAAKDACTAVVSPLPVVFGQDLVDGTLIRPDSIGVMGPSKCRMAITNTSPDPRIIQLQSPYHDDFLDTLAWAAAQNIDPDLSNELRRNLRGGAALYMRPFGKLAYNDRTVKGDSIVSDLTRHTDTLTERERGLLPRNVWVLGSPKDIPFGDPAGAGYLVQAGYLETLLDRSYVRAAPWWITVLLLLGSASWTWLLEKNAEEEERTNNDYRAHFKRIGAGFVILAGGTALMIVLLVILVDFGYRSDLASCSVLSVYLWFVGHLKRMVFRIKWIENFLN